MSGRSILAAENGSSVRTRQNPVYEYRLTQKSGRPKEESPSSALHPVLCDLLQGCKAVTTHLEPTRSCCLFEFTLGSAASKSCKSPEPNIVNVCGVYRPTLNFGMWLAKLALPRTRELELKYAVLCHQITIRVVQRF